MSTHIAGHPVEMERVTERDLQIFKQHYLELGLKHLFKERGRARWQYLMPNQKETKDFLDKNITLVDGKVEVATPFYLLNRRERNQIIRDAKRTKKKG